MVYDSREYLQAKKVEGKLKAYRKACGVDYRAQGIVIRYIIATVKQLDSEDGLISMELEEV